MFRIIQFCMELHGQQKQLSSGVALEVRVDVLAAKL